MTAGLGVPRTETWNGSNSTAPETPAGLATAETTSAAANATRYRPGPCTGLPYPCGFAAPTNSAGVQQLLGPTTTSTLDELFLRRAQSVFGSASHRQPMDAELRPNPPYLAADANPEGTFASVFSWCSFRHVFGSMAVYAGWRRLECAQTKRGAGSRGGPPWSNYVTKADGGGPGRPPPLYLGG